MADLTVGVVGVLSMKFRGDFWFATANANAVWLLGDAAGHIRQMTMYNNHATNNSGIFLVTETAMPPVILFRRSTIVAPFDRVSAKLAESGVNRGFF